MAWADESEHKPFIESLNGSVSGNTLTLTATMNYDNIENQIRESVKYHWTKRGIKQDGNNNMFTDNNALTTEPIQWEVYATYTYQEHEYTTNTMYYTQTPPVVKLTGAVSGDNLNLTASFNDYNGSLTDIQYHWLTYTYDEDDKRTPHEDETNHSATKTVPAIKFEEEVWHVYATYTYNAQQYQTEPDRYLQEATPLPTLTVSKVEDHEQGHDMLVMNASLSPDYSTKVAELKYHWSNNAVEQTDHYNAHREVPHAFDTQLWRCWATFTYDGKEYKTNDDTYTYYSTLGHLNFHADKQSDGTIKATLDDATSLHTGVSVAYYWKDSKGNTDTGTSYTRTSEAEWVEFTATITQNGTSNKLIKYAFYSFDGEHTVVYIKYTGGGNDNNDGRTPETPVATWKKAYSLLNNGGWDQNIIVIVNGTGTGNMIINDDDTDGKAATITGQWPLDKAMDHSTAGIIYVSGSTTNDKTGARIGAPTRFRNVVFYSAQGKTSRFSCHLHDVKFDEGVVMKNFPNLATNSGATSGRTAPDFHLQLYADQYANAIFPQDKNKVMQVTIKSGQFGRILASRIAGTKATNTYIIGRHDNPLKANITIDIQDIVGNRTASPGKTYADDIAYIAAGLTQGMMWGDITMNIKRGSIATLVAGSQGNALTMGSLKVPVSTYCGRTEVNVMAENNSDVVIQNYYGACQGRVYNDNDPLICDAYFYGKSTLNMTGGTIQADIFASSAGISGLRSSDPDYFAKKWYTSDQRIPYPGSFAYGIDYLPYDRNKQIVTMTTHNGTIDLNDTEIQMNISGGIVKNVYGGSYGYSDVLPAKVAPAHAGRLFGNTSVNISGGTVTGSVYAGGKGSTQYYTDAAAAKKADFSDVAQVYGNTNVTITGTPNFQGNIYGGGAGVESTSSGEFLDIAKVYGNTNILFDADYTDANPFKGNIYGGGAKGGVEGNTNVIISKGVIVGNVYGGSQGEEGHPNKAKVVGTTKVVIGE